MSPSELPRAGLDLAAGLDAERGAWQGLLDILGQEEQALVGGDADRLAPLSASKLAQLQTLGTLAQARRDQLLAAGHSADHAGMAAWLHRHGRPEQSARWQQLCELEQQAQAMNQRVGALINLRLAATRQALNVLIHAATAQHGLYDQSGLSIAAAGSGKPLTSA